MKVPFLDLYSQYLRHQQELDAAMNNVFRHSAFIGGKEVRAFEQEFAEWLGVEHCIGCGNGTDALEILLEAMGIGPGDEVIVPAMTWISTAEAVTRTGACPVFADVLPNLYTLDPQDVAQKITSRTRAMIPVHLYGQPAEMNELQSLAKDHGLRIVEDCAQAHGATYHGTHIGTLGDAAAFSFYPGKNLGAYGDAGAITTDDGELANRARRLRNYGSEVKYHHPEVGFNSRLDTLPAVVLGAKLKRLTMWNKMRQEAADRYFDLLGEAQGIELPESSSENQHVWHIYAVRVQHREAVLTALHKAGVGAGIHYPIPIHLLGAFEFLEHKEGDFPKAESAASEMISLPMFPGISEAQQVEVSRALVAAGKDSQDS